MCEVAVCKGDDGRHARACSRVSRGECDGVESERRDTQVCVGGIETTTATIERQGPSSGCSFNGDSAGFAQRRARGPGRATHETPTCSFAGVRPGPGMPAVDVANPADGQKPGLGSWIRTGWVLSVARAVCSVCRVHGTGYGRAEHICSRGEPLGLRGLLLGMRRVTSWLHVWSESGRRG